VQTALHTQIHSLLVNGEKHYANVTDPSVPAAIQPFTIGFIGLTDFIPKSTHHSTKPVADFNYDGEHVLAPGDLYEIYNIGPLVYNGISGFGMTLAVAGQSAINVADIIAYKTYFGLPTSASGSPDPITMLVPNATNPGITSGEVENDLDLEISGTAAPFAQLLFVYSNSSQVSAFYALDNALAPVLTYSYGNCEVQEGTSGATSFQTMAQQGNSEGMTWLASTGDSGAAGCDPDGKADLASDGISVNLPASVPEVTGVGGTTFNESSGSYWSTVNGSYAGSALSYIPEVGWNDSSPSIGLSSSGGGMSILFARPTWQVGNGVQAINVRFVPDVSMSASANHDGYFVITGGAQTVQGGTSAATPLTAGIVLLMNQYLGTNGLGNINPNLYKLASIPNNVCLTGQATPACVIHDVQTGTNLVPCVAGTAGCIGGSLGYSAGAGYDMVTGLGTINATNLVGQFSGGPSAITQIFNGASYVDTGLSPGLIFSVKGSGLGPTVGIGVELQANGTIATSVAGIELLVNGTPAPLLYVSSTQINAVAPYELTNYVGERVTVQLVNSGVPGATISDLVVNTAPAMFNLGNNQAAIINQDGTVNAANNPAARGTIISIYATGEGQTNPPGKDGFLPTSASNLSRPLAGVAVSFANGAFQGTVDYAGTASFDGFFQVNVVVPGGLNPGPAPITLNVGGISSPTLNIYVK
jgi:uncharacterized protein (TIGR03437 family)